MSPSLARHPPVGRASLRDPDEGSLREPANRPQGAAIEDLNPTPAHLTREALLEEVGSHSGWIQRMNEETIRTIRAQLDEAAFAEAWEEGRKLTADEAVALALESLE